MQTAQTSTPSGRCMMGAETEYGYAALDANGMRDEHGALLIALIAAVRKEVAFLQCSSDMDIFTGNGSRVYVDCGGHPEVATAECGTPEEVVRLSRAGDHLLASAAQSVQRDGLQRGLEIVLWKGNVDHRTGATWGSHESYLHVVRQDLLQAQLMTHLVTRIVYCGAGGFNNRSKALQFVIAPRAFHLEADVSGSSTRARGIFHTRNEPLAGGRYRRLHVLAGESLWSHTADFLRFGTTALLVAQIDAGRTPQSGLDLASPVEALTTLAADVELHATLRLRSSGALTAIAIQRHLLESVEADLGASHLPPWAEQVCARWRSVLEQLEASPTTLVGVLDWPTKLSILKRQCERQDVEWRFSSDAARRRPRWSARRGPATRIVARLLETDMRFNRLDGRGIFRALDAQGVLAHRLVDDAAVEQAVDTPPTTGRARIRAAWVKRLCGNGRSVTCSWDRIVDRKRRRLLTLHDPFRCEGEQWRELEVRDELDLMLGRPPSGPRVTEETLHAMRRRLIGGEQTVPSTWNAFHRTLASVVPDIPVPVLPRYTGALGLVLNALHGCVSSHHESDIVTSVGTLLYRYHEGTGDLDRAREVTEDLLLRVGREGDERYAAVLTNNLGYQHLLAGDAEAALARFQGAIAELERAGSRSELLNARANLLECRAALLEPEQWATLLPELKRVHRGLLGLGDWRVRKTMLLQARQAVFLGARRRALNWMKRAVAAAVRKPTRLNEADRLYLEAIEQGHTDCNGWTLPRPGPFERRRAEGDRRARDAPPDAASTTHNP